jgi:hypothetical protein
MTNSPIWRLKSWLTGWVLAVLACLGCDPGNTKWSESNPPPPDGDRHLQQVNSAAGQSLPTNQSRGED